MNKRMPLAVIAAALVAGAGFSGGVTAQEETPPQVSRSSLPRDAVKADLQAWRSAGMNDAWRGESTPDFTHPGYAEMYDRYVQAMQRSQYAHSAPARLPGQGG